MKCTVCGNEISPNQSFCNKCGAPVAQQNNAQNMYNQPVNNANQNVYSGNQNAYGQPNMNGNNFNGQVNNMGQNGYNQPPKKGGVPVWVFIVVILAVVIIMLGIILFIVFGNGKKDEDDDLDVAVKNSVERVENDTNQATGGTSPNNTIENVSTNNTTGGNAGNTVGNTTGDNTGNTKTVVLGNWSYKIPSDRRYTFSSGAVVLEGKDNNTATGIKADNQKVSATIFSDPKIKNALTESFNSKGAVVNSIIETTIDGMQCYKSEITYEGLNMLNYFIRRDDSNLFELVVTNKAGTYDTLTATNDAEIVKTATSLSLSGNLETQQEEQTENGKIEIKIDEEMLKKLTE